MSEQKAAVKMVQLDIDSLDWLYQSYMKFLIQGGIFFFSSEDFSLGDEVFLVLTINIDFINKKYPIRSEIVWKNSNFEIKGYGVSFGNDEVSNAAKKEIEALLENVIDSDKKTFTM